MLNAEILELESQLDAANMNIKFKMEEELKAKKMTNEITEALNETQKELNLLNGITGGGITDSQGVEVR